MVNQFTPELIHMVLSNSAATPFCASPSSHWNYQFQHSLCPSWENLGEYICLWWAHLHATQHD